MDGNGEDGGPIHGDDNRDGEDEDEDEIHGDDDREGEGENEDAQPLLNASRDSDDRLKAQTQVWVMRCPPA